MNDELSRTEQGKGTMRTVAMRLRDLRADRGWTLKDVEDLTGGRVKASALGSYERLDRSISLFKLERLAEVYGVSLPFLLGLEEGLAGSGAWQESRPPVRMDLRRLRSRPELSSVARFAAEIRSERGDFGGSMLTVRSGDLRTMALLMRISPQRLISTLNEAGVVSMSFSGMGLDKRQAA